MKYITFILSDKVVFPVFEISFLLLFFYAFWRGKGFSKNSLGIIRGKESRNIYYLTFGIALIILLQVINSANALKKYKTIITIINLSILAYLLFFNSWIRNKIIGFTTNSRKKAE